MSELYGNGLATRPRSATFVAGCRQLIRYLIKRRRSGLLY